MMNTISDVHQQFAEYFNIPVLKPYAYLLSKSISEGHICLHLDKPVSSDAELPAYCNDMVTGSEPLLSAPLVARNGTDNEPFILYQNRLYLQRYFRYETIFLNRIHKFLEVEKVLLNDRIAILKKQQKLIRLLFDTKEAVDDNEPANWQLAAAITGVLNNFSIVTGGPGTGKTTTVARILAILFNIDPSLKVALAAPTGKAAARMAESLRNIRLPLDDSITEKLQQLSPSTIHRLLKSVKDSPYFRHNAGNPLNYDVVIIDESSMIDIALFAKLLDAIGPDTRLILLGDKDQLASVEAGSLFGDLCQAQKEINLFSPDRLALINSFISDKSRQIPDSQTGSDTSHPLFQHLVELRRSHRFTGHKGIGKFSKAIINNNRPVLEEFLHEGHDDQVVIDVSYSRDLFESFISGYEDFIKENDITKALQKINNLRVLCAVREGNQGVYAINKAIEKYLYDKKLIKINAEFYKHRPIILTRNYYEHNLFNGDTGIIRPDENGVLMAWFEDGTDCLKAVLPGYLTEAQTVFAMTIHKSQGSEFNMVMVLLPMASGAGILTRELIYTAVTRAKSMVYVQSSAELLLQSAERSVERASGIANRFIED